MSEPSVRGKVVVITGAITGIGRIAAERLAEQGARIVMVARDRERAEATLAWLREVGPDTAHRAHYAGRRCWPGVLGVRSLTHLTLVRDARVTKAQLVNPPPAWATLLQLR